MMEEEIAIEDRSQATYKGGDMSDRGRSAHSHHTSTYGRVPPAVQWNIINAISQQNWTPKQASNHFALPLNTVRSIYGRWQQQQQQEHDLDESMGGIGIDMDMEERLTSPEAMVVMMKRRVKGKDWIAGQRGHGVGMVASLSSFGRRRRNSSVASLRRRRRRTNGPTTSSLTRTLPPRREEGIVRMEEGHMEVVEEAMKIEEMEGQTNMDVVEGAMKIEDVEGVMEMDIVEEVMDVDAVEGHMKVEEVAGFRKMEEARKDMKVGEAEGTMKMENCNVRTPPDELELDMKTVDVNVDQNPMNVEQTDVDGKESGNPVLNKRDSKPEIIQNAIGVSPSVSLDLNGLMKELKNRTNTSLVRASARPSSQVLDAVLEDLQKPAQPLTPLPSTSALAPISSKLSVVASNVKPASAVTAPLVTKEAVLQGNLSSKGTVLPQGPSMSTHPVAIATPDVPCMPISTGAIPKLGPYQHQLLQSMMKSSATANVFPSREPPPPIATTKKVDTQKMKTSRKTTTIKKPTTTSDALEALEGLESGTPGDRSTRPVPISIPPQAASSSLNSGMQSVFAPVVELDEESDSGGSGDELLHDDGFLTTFLLQSITPAVSLPSPSAPAADVKASKKLTKKKTAVARLDKTTLVKTAALGHMDGHASRQAMLTKCHVLTSEAALTPAFTIDRRRPCRSCLSCFDLGFVPNSFHLDVWTTWQPCISWLRYEKLLARESVQECRFIGKPGDAMDRKHEPHPMSTTAHSLLPWVACYLKHSLQHQLLGLLNTTIYVDACLLPAHTFQFPRGTSVGDPKADSSRMVLMVAISRVLGLLVYQIVRVANVPTTSAPHEANTPVAYLTEEQYAVFYHSLVNKLSNLTRDGHFPPAPYDFLIGPGVTTHHAHLMRQLTRMVVQPRGWYHMSSETFVRLHAETNGQILFERPILHLIHVLSRLPTNHPSTETPGVATVSYRRLLRRLTQLPITTVTQTFGHFEESLMMAVLYGKRTTAMDLAKAKADMTFEQPWSIGPESHSDQRQRRNSF